MLCPVCDYVLSAPFPEFCPKCHKKLRKDITLNQSLDKVPDSFSHRYEKWLRLYRKFYKVKIQLQDIVDEFSFIKEDLKILKEETIVELTEFIEFNFKNTDNKAINKTENKIKENVKTIIETISEKPKVSETKNKDQVVNIPVKTIIPKAQNLLKTTIKDNNINKLKETKKVFKEPVLLDKKEVINKISKNESKNQIKVQGLNIYNDLKEDKIKTLTELKNYLRELKLFDDPNDIFSFSINNPESSLDNNGNIILNIETSVYLNPISQSKAKVILSSYKDIIYKNNEVNYLTKKISGTDFSSYGIRTSINLALLDENENVIEILEKRIDKTPMNAFFTVYNSSLDKHNEGIFIISMLDIPKNGLSAGLSWKHKISEEKLQHLHSVKFIFREKSPAEINYTENYDSDGNIYFYEPVSEFINIKEVELDKFYNRQLDEMIENINSEIERLNVSTVHQTSP